VSRKVVHWCRAVSFGKPIGPWRFGLSGARRDLVAEGLGSYDPDGIFFVTVPGGIERRAEWMDLAEAEQLSRSVQRRHAAEHTERLTVSDQDRRVSGVGRARYKASWI
jgi:hypothetical protein